MYAVLSSGGKQYRVEAGNELILERVPGDVGASITFDRVLLVGDGDAVTVGTPTVRGATVSGTVLGEALGPKLIVFKFKQKATYRRKNGHRQHLTRVRIDEILTGKGTKARAKAEPADEAASPTATRSTADQAETAEKAGRKPAARTRKPAAKADAADEADASATAEADAKPKRARRPATRKAEAEE